MIEYQFASDEEKQPTVPGWDPPLVYAAEGYNCGGTKETMTLDLGKAYRRSQEGLSAQPLVKSPKCENLEEGCYLDRRVQTSSTKLAQL
ncbi:unnamed protein product [Haemonchus placei]|uniref:Uncharacterized protein n=1 Tax=Haemonchus placei TaxID=6290 RepID=A0A0N4WJ63_HAEPC|nr:unnamed protein product [Haemonchus placei]